MPAKNIDVHAHINPRPFLEAMRAGKDWLGFSADSGELENPANHWSLEERIADMDAIGEDMQALTIYGGFVRYRLDPAHGLAVSRACNDEVAAMVAAHPDRFVGIGMLPMQDVPAAVGELQRLMTRLGLKGVIIKDHVNGHTYDEPQFLPFWEAAEALGAVVEFHQGATIVAERIPRYFLENTVGNLVERVLTFGTLVQGGIIDRFPGLKLCLLHGGGYTAFGLARMDKGWEAQQLEYMRNYSAGEDARQQITRPPSTYAGAFYYDCATFSEPTLRFLIDTVGIDRVVLGTDYPCPMQIIDPVNWINSLASLTIEEKQAILCDNPRRMLGI